MVRARDSGAENFPGCGAAPRALPNHSRGNGRGQIGPASEPPHSELTAPGAHSPDQMLSGVWGPDGAPKETSAHSRRMWSAASVRQARHPRPRWLPHWKLRWGDRLGGACGAYVTAPPSAGAGRDARPGEAPCPLPGPILSWRRRFPSAKQGDPQAHPSLEQAQGEERGRSVGAGEDRGQAAVPPPLRPLPRWARRAMTSSVSLCAVLLSI